MSWRALTRRERQVLRQIEQALRRTDPDLARLLRGAWPHSSTRSCARSITGPMTVAFLVVAAVMIGWGLLSDPSLILGGILVLTSAPPVVVLVAATEYRP